MKKSEFDKLTIEEKRISVAKDVIERLTAKTMIPSLDDDGSVGFIHFWQDDSYLRHSYLFQHLDADPKNIINENKCTVCVKGALVCSWIGQYNNVNGDEFLAMGEDVDEDEYPPELLELFDIKTLDLMEVAYEGKGWVWTHDEVAALYSCASDEVLNKSLKGSLLGIMQNIIANDGTFVFDPSEELDQPEKD